LNEIIAAYKKLSFTDHIVF